VDLQSAVFETIFFACGALLTGALTKWPFLWVAGYSQHSEMRKRFERSAGTLQYMTGIGCILCLGGLFKSLVTVVWLVN